ncbi:hypothetical protein [Cupriavidus sp. UYPR2.512]|uniref:hypothetical protein n=1 Tax=Cupriavidus sp. UYPR2.512 TaxID=1080187 RepID=UPI0003719B98|nr:hypothetical protein [Cupriavidus sp. UYPR2.512]UIF90861.1 hypothetical protein KAF44_32245 [Cupriavidus necator]
MTLEQFAYWLQGFAELTGDTPPTPEQWKSIREHLATVFNKVTPAVRTPPVIGPAIAEPATRPLPDAWPSRQWTPHYLLAPNPGTGVAPGAPGTLIC